MRRMTWIALLALLCWSTWANAQSVEVMSWNVESGGSSPQVIAQRIAAHDGADLWGLSEVQDDGWAQTFEQAAEQGEGANFERIVGTTGGADRLVILYDADRFERIEWFELAALNIGGNVRAPLGALLRLRETGESFIFMVNHLYRSNATRRHEQARLLNEWAPTEPQPIIAVGDYNFDWDVANGDANHDAGYDRMTDGDVFRWVRPAALVRTQASFNSVLDFVFAANGAKAWSATSEILAVPGDFPDGPTTSDHRPLMAQFQLGATPVDPHEELRTMIQQFEDRLRALEQDLTDLKARIPPP